MKSLLRVTSSPLRNYVIAIKNGNDTSYGYTLENNDVIDVFKQTVLFA